MVQNVRSTNGAVHMIRLMLVPEAIVSESDIRTLVTKYDFFVELLVIL